MKKYLRKLSSLQLNYLNLDKSSTYPTYDVPICLFFRKCPYTLCFFSSIRYDHIRLVIRPRYVSCIYVEFRISSYLAHTQALSQRILTP